MSMIPRICLSILAVSSITLSACNSTRGGSSGPKDGKFSMPPSPGEDWHKVGQEDGSLSYIRVADPSDDDVITLFASSEMVESKIGSYEELAQYIRNKGIQGLLREDLEVTTFRGVPGVRYEIFTRDVGTGGSPETRAKLGLMERQPGTEYYVRTEVFAFMDPSDSTRIVNLGISRMSFHGKIGDAYGNIRNIFVSDFLSQNNIPGFNG